ncbi:MAG: prephenate dehydrogenase, partial [Verrucomicrobiota bacterium]
MRRISILGLGLMGGSLGLALRGSGWSRAGWARRSEVRDEAMEQDAVDEVFADPAEAVREADLVVICLPIQRIPELVGTIRDALKSGVIVTDVGSTKSTLMKTCGEILASTDGVFIGSHPIAGSEQQGLGAARADLYHEAVVVVTPEGALDDNHPLVEFWQSLGSVVRVMSAEEHDRYLARTSHLPHMVASVLARTVGRDRLDETGFFCGTGFRDTSRVGGGAATNRCDNVQSHPQARRGALTANPDTPHP